jgi:dolichol-phosphate mannosyltransferase
MSPTLCLKPLAPADYRISVVLPVFSETDTVVDIVNWLRRRLARQLQEIIIVLSPSSSPRSKVICNTLAAREKRIRLHVQRKNPGLGHAVREGMRRVRGNVVLLMDSDGEMEIETVPRLIAEMGRGNHGLVVASRWIRGGGFTGYNPLKYGLNWGFQQLFRVLHGTRLHDLTYGFKLMRAELARGIAWEGTLHEIACETTLKPVHLGVSVGEVASKWTRRCQGSSKNTFWRNFRYVAMALKILVLGVTLAAPPAAKQQLKFSRGRL